MGVGWKERRGWPWISLPCLLQKKPPPPHRQEGTVPSARCQPITQVLRWARLNCQEFGTDARPVQRQSPAAGRQVGGLQRVGEEVAAAPAPRRPSEPASSRLLEQSLGKRRREGVPPSRAFPQPAAVEPAWPGHGGPAACTQRSAFSCFSEPLVLVFYEIFPPGLG